MFDDLRAAFREALDNFNKELSRDQVPETVDRLLGGMKSEIVDEKAEVAGLEDQLEKTRAQIKRVSEEESTARRREEMARRIEDIETANLAAKYAAKHQSYREVLEHKASALQEEVAFRQRTVEEMYARFHEAEGKRDALTATTGRSGARESISAADDLFSELDRMEEKIEGNRARGEAAEEFDKLDLDNRSEYHIDLDDTPPEELDVDAALAELKRRMKDTSGN
jgi:phage shock protein A